MRNLRCRPRTIAGRAEQRPEAKAEPSVRAGPYQSGQDRRVFLVRLRTVPVNRKQRNRGFKPPVARPGDRSLNHKVSGEQGLLQSFPGVSALSEIPFGAVLSSHFGCRHIDDAILRPKRHFIFQIGDSFSPLRPSRMNIILLSRRGIALPGVSDPTAPLGPGLRPGAPIPADGGSAFVRSCNHSRLAWPEPARCCRRPRSPVFRRI